MDNRINQHIVLAASTFGSAYLCAKALEQLNKSCNSMNEENVRLPGYKIAFYSNCLIFGMTGGFLFSVFSEILLCENFIL